MDHIDRLSELFQKFPGIGPRQAQRFVNFLLRGGPALRHELADAIESVGTAVSRCPECHRFHAGDEEVCSICSDKKRGRSLLAIVAHDADLLAIERSGTYRGLYFVLGGTVSLSSEKHRLRDRDLIKSLPERIKHGLKEIILALPASPEGDMTASFVRDLIAPLAHDHKISITALGRGLSTGSELEYADSDTLKSAIENRK